MSQIKPLTMVASQEVMDFLAKDENELTVGTLQNLLRIHNFELSEVSFNALSDFVNSIAKQAKGNVCLVEIPETQLSPIIGNA